MSLMSAGGEVIKSRSKCQRGRINVVAPLVILGFVANAIVPRFFVGGIWVYPVLPIAVLLAWIWLGGISLGFARVSRVAIYPVLMLIVVLISTLSAWIAGIVPVERVYK